MKVRKNADGSLEHENGAEQGPPERDDLEHESFTYHPRRGIVTIENVEGETENIYPKPTEP